MVPTLGREAFADCENPAGERTHMKSAVEATAAIRFRSLMSDSVMNQLTAGRREVANRNFLSIDGNFLYLKFRTMTQIPRKMQASEQAPTITIPSVVGSLNIISFAAI